MAAQLIVAEGVQLVVAFIIRHRWAIISGLAFYMKKIREELAQEANEHGLNEMAPKRIGVPRQMVVRAQEKISRRCVPVVRAKVGAAVALKMMVNY